MYTDSCNYDDDIDDTDQEDDENGTNHTMALLAVQLGSLLCDALCIMIAIIN